MKKIDGSFAGKGYGPVIIEENVWIGNNCQITPNSHISNYSVISAGSVVNRRMEQTSYGIYGGNPAKLVAEGFYRDLKDDTFISNSESLLLSQIFNGNLHIVTLY